MLADLLVRSWLALLGFSIATTVLTLVDARGAVAIAVAAGVLVLAGLKARIILAHYLALSKSRFWMGAFDGALAGFLGLAFAIYLIGNGG